jgi:hypothetical protein
MLSMSISMLVMNRRFNVGGLRHSDHFFWHPHGIPPGSSEFQDLDRSMLQMVVSTRQLPVWWTRCSHEVGCIVNYFGYDRENYTHTYYMDIYILAIWLYVTYIYWLYGYMDILHDNDIYIYVYTYTRYFWVIFV